jgi:hypothetical protein
MKGHSKLPSGKQRATLTGYQICQYLDLGLPDHQNCKKHTSVAYKLPTHKYFVIAAGTMTLFYPKASPAH